MYIWVHEGISFLQDTAKQIMPASITQVCLVVDVLGIDFRSHLIDRYVALELKEYRRIFRTNDEAGQLDNISRRFAWFRRLISNHELEQGRVFPSQWKVGWFFLGKFAEITRWVLFLHCRTTGFEYWPEMILRLFSRNLRRIWRSNRCWMTFSKQLSLNHLWQKNGPLLQVDLLLCFLFSVHVEKYSLAKSLDLRVPRISHKKPFLLPLNRILAFLSRLKTGEWYSCQVVYIFVTHLKDPGRNACTS